MKRIDLIWGYSAQLLNIGVGLLLLPILVITLNSEDLGLLFVFMTMISLAQLLEFGFQPTIARQVAYIYSGASEIKNVGLPLITEGSVNINLLVNVIHSAKKIYMWIAVLVALLLWCGGSLYIYSLSYTGDLFTAYISWFLFAGSSVITFYFGYFNSLLQGRGDITLVNKTIVASRLCYAILAVIFLLFKFNLLALGIASILSCILNRLLISRAFYNSENQYLKNIKPNDNLRKILWTNTWRLGAVQLGGFLIQRGNLFIAATFLGLTISASYGLTLQLSMIIMALANQLTLLQLPKMNALQVAGNKSELRKVYSSSVFVAFIVSILGFLLLTIFGNGLLVIIGSETKLIDEHILLLLGLVLLLEVNHSVSATYLTTTNKVPFLKASLLSGFAVILCSFVLVYWGGWGIAGLIIGQGVVQLCFNNWYWPRVAMRDLNVNFIDIVVLGSKRIAGY